MRNTSTILTFALLLLISCKHVETPLETHDRYVKSSIESISSKVDSLTGTKGVQKTLFLIDTNDIKYKHLVRLNRTTMNRILNGILIKESEISNAFDTTSSVFFYFDALTKVFNDSAFVILQKEHLIFENIRLFLVQTNKGIIKIKLLAAEDSYPCMSVLTMSTLLGDSILYTQEILEAVSDAGSRNGKIWTVNTKEIKKYSFQDFSYTKIDSLRTDGFK
jgi:hypothetical protein